MSEHEAMRIKIRDAATAAIKKAVGNKKYKVWIGDSPSSGLRGETFEHFTEALDYFKDQSTYAGYVAIEQCEIIKEYRK